MNSDCGKGWCLGKAGHLGIISQFYCMVFSFFLPKSNPSSQASSSPFHPNDSPLNEAPAPNPPRMDEQAGWPLEVAIAGQGGPAGETGSSPIAGALPLLDP